MPRYSPSYYSPPRRGYGGGGPRSPPRRGYGGGGPRSPPRRGYGGGGGGGYGRRKEQNGGSLLVRNIPLDCRSEELRVPFERFGIVRDVYLPKDYYTGGEPRGFAFVQFIDSYEASEAQYHMDGQIFAGRQISVVLAAETRKRPEEMRQRSRVRGPSSGYGGRRSSHYGRSRSRSVSRSRSPRRPSGSRSRYRSRSYSPAPRRRGDYSRSPRRHADPPRSPGTSPQERDRDHNDRRSYSPHYDDAAAAAAANQTQSGNGISEKPAYESEEAQARWREIPSQASRSPSGSRSRSADVSPR